MVAVSQHFNKKRTIAFGLSASGVGVGTIVFPFLIDFLEQKYSWRGALLICGGLTLNICAFAIALSPKSPVTKENPLKIEEEAKMKTFDIKTFSEHFKVFLIPQFGLLIANNILYCFALIIVYIHISAYVKVMYSLSDSACAMFVSIIGVSNLIGRVALGFISHLPSVTSLCVYKVSLLSSFVATLFIPIVNDILMVGICCAIFGFCSAGIGTILPDVVVNLVGQERFGPAFGFILIFEAAGTLAGGPVSGT